jgi:hypothetical protein
MNKSSSETDENSRRSIISRGLGALLSGRLFVGFLLIGGGASWIFKVWNSPSEFWFSIAVEIGAGAALFVAIQNVPKRWLNFIGGSVIFFAALTGLYIAFDKSGRLQALLIELSCGALLFLALEWLLGKLILKMKKQEEELVRKTVEYVVKNLPQVGYPEDFDTDAYIEELRERYKDWPSFYSASPSDEAEASVPQPRA